MSARHQSELFAGDALVRPAPRAPALEELAARLPKTLRLGTSSWSFPGWRGLVWRDGPEPEHDERTLSRHGLAAYAAHPLFTTVSIDRGHYQPIDPITLEEYAAQVPGSFRFVLKAWSALTTPVVDGAPSPKFLDPALAWDTVVEPSIQALGDRLGVLLFQFPPASLADLGGDAFVPRLARFLDDVQARCSRPVPTIAVELRTPALVSHHTRDALFHVGAVPSLNLRTGMPDVVAQLKGLVRKDTPVLVVRWLLRMGLQYDDARAQWAPFDKLAAPDAVTRSALADIIARAPMPTFVLANNKAEGSAPLTLARLAEAVGDRSPVAERSSRSTGSSS